MADSKTNRLSVCDAVVINLVSDSPYVLSSLLRYVCERLNSKYYSFETYSEVYIGINPYFGSIHYGYYKISYPFNLSILLSILINDIHTRKVN